MIHRFDIADTLTPDHGTAISEWMRLADVRADGCTVHEVRNRLACLMSVRFQASDGWSPELREKDAHCEAELRALLQGLWRRQLFGCNLRPSLAAVG